MKTVSLIDVATGLFTGVTLQLPEEAIAQNTPAGCKVIEGQFDHLSQRVDLKTGDVIDYQPPQPSDDHEWDAEVKRWALKPEVLEAQAAAAEALAKINLQEAGSLRAIRELLLNPDNTEARAKLQAVDDAIAAERPKIAEKGDIREQLERKLEEITGQYPAAVDQRMRVNEVKIALREVMKEWLDERVRQVGRWSLRGISLAAFTALIYFILTHSGWTHK